MSRRILLVDCDQFFVQCARLADPDGAGREELLLVGGSPSGRGVVTSASYATRAFGVRSGMPTAQALRLCPAARVVPVPRGLCGRKSRDVRAVLQRFTPIVEPASIDEAYMDMTGTEELYREPLDATAQRIRAAVLADAAISVSIGGGTSRLVAKLAAGRAKPAGVRIVEPGGEVDFMRALRLSDIPGVGPVFAAHLERMGLSTVEGALGVSEVALCQMLGHTRGRWLYRRVRGVDGGVVRPDLRARSVSREETFPLDIDDDAALETELLALAGRVAADLREHDVRARTITVKLRDADFRTRRAARTLRSGIESDRAVFATARLLLQRLRAARRSPARLLGVAASGLDNGGLGDQLALFDGEAIESERDRLLSRTTDQLRKRFGSSAIRPAALGTGDRDRRPAGDR
jgi:DNA polymerase-4